jgi:calcium/calmodulin-dependent protein kinase I
MPLEDKYTLAKKLGQGQYGEVWAGHPIGKDSGSGTNLPDIVAVKIFKKICRATMVENEIQIMSLVGSIKDQNADLARNVVDVFDTQLLSSNGRKSFVMEHLSGHELFDRIVDKGCYSERDAAQTLANLATSLDLLHRNHILHRDLKPENIVYRTGADDADAVIVDFGFGLVANKTTSSGSSYFQDPNGREPLGTHGYIAPESYESCIYMDKSDIWALGVITYTILVGFPPFDSKDRQLSLRTRRGKYYPLSSDPWKDVSAEAKDLVARMLTVNPEQRPSAAQVLEHPWIAKWVEREDVNRGDSYMERMSKMQAKQKLKKTINGVVGAIRFKKAAVNVELKRQEAAARAAGDTDPTLVRELSVSHHQIRQLSTSLTKSESMKEGSAPSASRQSSVFSATEKEDVGAMFDEATLTKMRGQGLNYDEFCAAVRSVKLDCLANVPVFEIFDESGDGLVTITEFLTALAAFRNKIVHQSTKFGSLNDATREYATGGVESIAEKSKFFFSIFDLDKSGTISRKELYQVIGMLLAESNEENTFRQRHSRRAHDTEVIGRESIAMSTEEEVADYLVTDAYPMSDEIDLEAVFKEIDTDGSGEISLEEFTEWFAKGEADGLFASILDPMTQTETRMSQMLEGH